MRWFNIGDGTCSCCLLLGIADDLEQTGVGSNAGRRLLFAICCGLEVIACGSNGGGPLLYFADSGLVLYCFL